MQTTSNAVSQIDNRLVLQVSGDLTSTTAAKVRAEIQFLFELPEGRKVPWNQFRLDLAAAQKVDSVGLNLIVNIYKAVQKAGAAMQIQCRNQNVYRTLLFTRLDKFADVQKIA